MKDLNSELRNPKEVRSPNVEAMPGASEFLDWAEKVAGTQEALREDGIVSPPPPRDLLERTALFAEAVIRFAKKVPRGPTTNRLIDQVVGAGSSVAANFCEADDAVSGKDFKKSIGTCRKESKETMLFLRLNAMAEESLAAEAKELNLIFGAIWRK
jgi:four helix bundle protein